MFQRTLPSTAIVVCVVDEDASALKTTTEVLSSTGYEIRAFRDGDTFLNLAQSARLRPQTKGTEHDRA
jgi:FixJ family two-component response regulator